MMLRITTIMIKIMVKRKNIAMKEKKEINLKITITMLEITLEITTIMLKIFLNINTNVKKR